MKPPTVCPYGVVGIPREQRLYQGAVYHQPSRPAQTDGFCFEVSGRQHTNFVCSLPIAEGHLTRNLVEMSANKKFLDRKFKVPYSCHEHQKNIVRSTLFV